MKIIGAIFLIAAVSILLIGSIAAIQSQADIGDTVIDNESSGYDEYQEIKSTTDQTFNFLSYTPLLLLIFAFIVIGAFMLGAVYLIKA
jgi:hypothetical protein